MSQKYVMIPVKEETKKKLDSIFIGRKTYDELINELIQRQLDFFKELGIDIENKEHNFGGILVYPTTRSDRKKKDVSAGNTDQKTIPDKRGQKN